MAGGEDALVLLRSIDASMRRLVEIAERRQQAAPRGAIASDADLDGQWGNPTIKQKDPRDWTGPSMFGKRYSETTAEYLDLLAARFDHFAEQADIKHEEYNGKPVAPYRRKDAARARGWARRLRNGYKAHEPEPPPAEGWGAPIDQDDITW